MSFAARGPAELAKRQALTADVADYKSIHQHIGPVVTTIQLDQGVKNKLNRLKIHPRDSYNKVVERLIEIRIGDGALGEEAIRDIERSLEDVRAGRTLSTKEVKRRLKIR
ncbi:MAG: DUF7557 family protein [Nitrososphaera sp.]